MSQEEMHSILGYIAAIGDEEQVRWFFLIQSNTDKTEQKVNSLQAEPVEDAGSCQLISCLPSFLHYLTFSSAF